MKIVRSIINTYWRKFWKVIDLDENLQITLTSLAQYSLALEIEMSILKPFERFKCFSLKINAIFMLHLHSRIHSECRILAVARASQISGGSVQESTQNAGF